MKLKISTLFHWLYATLMFLPILMFIPSCLYYGFNEHATNETTTQINYKYQSNEVNNINDLVVGNVYQLETFNLSNNYLPGDMDFYLLKYNNTDLFSNFSDYEGNNFNTKNCIIYLSTIDYQSNQWAVSIYLFEEESTALYFDYNNAITLKNCVFICNQSIIDYFEYNNNSTLPQYTDYNVIESVETNVQDTISNKMYLAWEGVWNLPLFQWTKNSFITAPFSYITGLFGLSSDNSINYVFTYFVSISICWLVFDLLMYVPNLAHRWLDRSALE